MEGFVYVMTNPAIAGLVKVGMTEKMPHLRAIEISAHEGLPAKMQLEYWALVTGSARKVEHSAHRSLASHHAGKEWFKCDAHVAIAAIRECAKDNLQHEKFLTADRQKAEEEKAKERLRIEQARMAEIAKKEAYDKVYSDFHRLHPEVERIMSRPFFKARLKTLPVEELILVVQYSQAGEILAKLNKYPKKSWLDELINGGYWRIGGATIDEFCRRVRQSQDKTPFKCVQYISEREILGLN